MVATESAMLPLGTTAPEFELPATEGSAVAIHDLDDAPALVVAFICNHCPYVKHVRHELAAMARDFQEQGVAVVGINSNDVKSYPDDSPEMMAKEKAEVGYPFPYLYDETQEVAKAYRATCTPDFYLFDADRRLVYRGQMDGSRPHNGLPVTGGDLRAAVDAVLAGRELSADQSPSMGCSIKWKPGHEPDYLG